MERKWEGKRKEEEVSREGSKGAKTRVKGAKACVQDPPPVANWLKANLNLAWGRAEGAAPGQTPPNNSPRLKALLTG